MGHRGHAVLHCGFIKGAVGTVQCRNFHSQSMACIEEHQHRWLSCHTSEKTVIFTEAQRLFHEIITFRAECALKCRRQCINDFVIIDTGIIAFYYFCVDCTSRHFFNAGTDVINLLRSNRTSFFCIGAHGTCHWPAMIFVATPP